MGLIDPVDLSLWTESDVKKFVSVFFSERFKTVLVLNKIDKKESEKWIGKLMERYGDEHTVLCSAASELYLQQLVRKKHIKYTMGDGDVVVEGEDLKAMDEKQKSSLKNIVDLILYRFGGTGVNDAINKAVQLANVIPVYIVKSIHNFGDGNDPGAFRDVIVVRNGVTFNEVAEMISGKEVDFIECAQTGQRVSVETIVNEDNNVVRFVFKDNERNKEED